MTGFRARVSYPLLLPQHNSHTSNATHIVNTCIAQRLRNGNWSQRSLKLAKCRWDWDIITSIHIGIAEVTMTAGSSNYRRCSVQKKIITHGHGIAIYLEKDRPQIRLRASDPVAFVVAMNVIESNLDL